MAKHFQPTEDSWFPPAHRYDGVPIRRVGESGLVSSAIALGFWHNFGDDRPFQTQRDIVRRAFELGVFHFDLANNYGPPAGSSEENFGRIMKKDFMPYREQMVITTKAGFEMWVGPTGRGGSRKYLLSSLEQSLTRMGLDHVDIFYHHCPDNTVPIEESMMALHDAVKQGKATYAGISSYGPDATRRAQEIMRDLGTPLVIHQPSYSLLNRWVEDPSVDRGTENDAEKQSLLQSAHEAGLGVIAFSPLAQGMLTNKYLNGVPENSRRGLGKMSDEFFTEENLKHIRALNDMAESRGQTLAQMAIAWVLRDQGPTSVTTALIGASSVAQLEDSVGAVKNLDFTAEELAAIDQHAVDSGINMWRGVTERRG